MSRFIRRLRWPDFVILAVLIVFFGYIFVQIDGTLNSCANADCTSSEVGGDITIDAPR